MFRRRDNVSAMATPEQIDSLEVGLTGWIGATNASTLLQLLGSRPRSSDLDKNLLVSTSLIADLHDAMTRLSACGRV